MKFTEMEDINKETDNSAREAFMDLLYGLQDYISNDFYNEKVEKPEQVSKIYNTIDDLQAKFADYESESDESEKSQISDYCTQMYDVIDALKAFAASGEKEEEPKQDDYADKVDEAFNKDPENALEQAGLVKEGE
jgi:septation ring formation regulator EzrA